MSTPAPKVHLGKQYGRAWCRAYGNARLTDDVKAVTCRRCLGDTGPKKHGYRPVQTGYPVYPSPNYCALCGLSNGHGFGCDGATERRSVERRA